jgi:hypothetical protein
MALLELYEVRLILCAAAAIEYFLLPDVDYS